MKSLQEMLKESFEKSYINDLDNYNKYINIIYNFL